MCSLGDSSERTNSILNYHNLYKERRQKFREKLSLLSSPPLSSSLGKLNLKNKLCSTILLIISTFIFLHQQLLNAQIQEYKNPPASNNNNWPSSSIVAFRRSQSLPLDFDFDYTNNNEIIEDLIYNPKKLQSQIEAADALSIAKSSAFKNNQLNSNPRGLVSPLKEYVELVVPPYENYDLDNRKMNDEVSYVIDHKRFIEAFPTRCMTSTFLQDPYYYEPNFILITPTNEIRLNATSSLELIKQAGFDSTKRTIIFVHGFTQSYPNTVWLRRTRALFETNLLVGKQNLIIMDYGIAASQAYAQVAAMASGIGSFLANFIMKLYQLGSNPMSIHIIGHSMGAHVAGFAGKKLKPKIGRITALDAAGPCFGKILFNSPIDRITPDDAYEVDVYHYDDDFLGLPGQNGQFDIYVNGGASQPGCSNNVNSMFQALITLVFRRNRVLSESHTRSTEVATVRLSTTTCQQVAYECRDYQSFLLGECGRCDDSNNQCFLMGFDYQYLDIGELPLRTSKPGKKLFISTGNLDPYCLQHYQFLIKFEPNPEQSQLAKRNKWKILFEAIDDENRYFSDVTITNQMAPNVFSYLYLTEFQPTRIKSARLQVKQSDGKFVQLSNQQQQQHLTKQIGLPYKIYSVEINFMSNINPKIRQSFSSRLCQVPTPQTAAGAAQNSIDTQNDNWIYFELCPPQQQPNIVNPPPSTLLNYQPPLSLHQPLASYSLV